MSVDPTLTQVMAQFTQAQALLTDLDNYYDGEQKLQFLHPDVIASTAGRLKTLVVNWPQIVVDSAEERLDIDGFRLQGETAPDSKTWDIWQFNDLDEWSQLAHVDSIVYGRSYATVWPNPDNPEYPKISVESPRQMWHVDAPGRRDVGAAVKTWTEGQLRQAVLYLPDRIDYYQAVQSSIDGASSSGSVGVAAGQWKQTGSENNPFGIVPVVPFINRDRVWTRPGRVQGRSDLADIVDLADAINKLCTDLMVTAEYHAMPRRWVTGVDMGGGDDETFAEMIRNRWTEAAAGRVWLLEDDNAKIGQFPSTDLNNFVHAIQLFVSMVAALGKLPPHYIALSRDHPASADAIRSAEAALVKRVERKQRALGGSWERVMRLAQFARDGQWTDGAHRMETIWRSPATPTTAQAADAATKLVAAGIIPAEQAREDLGYSPTAQSRMGEPITQPTANPAIG